MNKNVVDDIMRGLGDTLVKLESVKGDVEKQVRARLNIALDKLDIVSRDEYELQQAMSSRLYERLEALEKRVALLEQQVPISQRDDLPA